MIDGVRLTLEGNGILGERGLGITSAVCALYTVLGGEPSYLGQSAI